MTEYQFYDIRSDAISSVVSGQRLLGLDTEFMREKTFFSQLCLVQVATRSDILCIDPLRYENDETATTNWTELLSRTWVVHSARQDVEVIYQASGRFPEGLFDTQIAAALLGYPAQLGYANLVEELFGKQLAKTHTRADWSQRPLPAALLQYAAEDVEFLLPAYDLLCERLDQRGRLQWALEDSAALLVDDLYRSDPASAIDRLKGARPLSGSTRAAAARLAEWRERKAIASNRPRQWIMRDAVLLDLATARPVDKPALAAIGGLAPRTLQRHANAILESIQESARDDVRYRPPPRPDEHQKAMLKKMQTRVASRAEELGLAAELIAAKKDLSAALSGNRQIRLFKGWRRELVGSELLELLG